MKIKDRVAIITGATSGIREASALLFAEEGAKVMVTFHVVDDQSIVNHLQGRHVMGVYPLLEDDACWFLAADSRRAVSKHPDPRPSQSAP